MPSGMIIKDRSARCAAHRKRQRSGYRKFLAYGAGFMGILGPLRGDFGHCPLGMSAQVGEGHTSRVALQWEVQTLNAHRKRQYFDDAQGILLLPVFRGASS